MHQKRTALCHPFLSSEGVKLIEIHRRMKVQHGDACLSLQQLYEWTRKFMKDISSVTDSPRTGQAHRVVRPEAIAAVEAIMRARNGTIPPHQNRKNSAHNHLRKRLC